MPSAPPPPLNLSRPGDADDCWWQTQQWRQSDLCNCYKRWFAWNLLLHYNRQRTIADNDEQCTCFWINRGLCAMSENKHNMWSDLQASCLVFPFSMYFFFRVGWLGIGARKPNQNDEHDSQAMFSWSFEGFVFWSNSRQTFDFDVSARGLFRCVLHQPLGAPSDFVCKYTTQSSIRAPGLFLWYRAYYCNFLLLDNQKSKWKLLSWSRTLLLIQAPSSPTELEAPAVQSGNAACWSLS